MTKNVSFQDLQSELQQVTDALQQESDIDQALKLYERGQELTKQLEDYLENAKNIITKIDARISGEAEK